MDPTRIEIDDTALRETMRYSGARTEAEAVNLALRVFAARHRSRVEANRERDRRESEARRPRT